ncbi:MAG: hypothetical protein ACXAD7_28180, partial [Candidatus Kariarchaeaceae archaeon]
LISVIGIFTIKPSIDITNSVYEGNIDRIFGYWQANDSSPITFGSISAKLYQGDNFIDSLFSQTDSNGEFTFDYDYTGLFNGTYTWLVEFSKVGYERQTVTTTVLILPHTTQIEIDIPDTGTRGDPFIITIEVTYNDNQSTNLSLNEIVQHTTGPVANVNISITFDVIFENGQIIPLQKNGTTDNNGIATLRLYENETKDIVRIIGISIDNFDFPSGYNFTQTNLEQLNEIVKLEDSLYLTTKNQENGLQLLYPYIIALILISAIIFAGLSIRYFTKMQYLRFEKENHDAYEEIMNLSSIRGIIMFSLENQSPFYGEKFGIFEADPTLVAGIISALWSFLDEIGQKMAEGFQTMNRVGLSIMTHKSNISTISIISSGNLSQQYLTRFKKAQKSIDLHYWSEIQQQAITVRNFDPNIISEKLEALGLKLHLLRGVILDNNRLNELVNSTSIKPKGILFGRILTEPIIIKFNSLLSKPQLAKLKNWLKKPDVILLENLLRIPEQISHELRIDSLIHYLEFDKGLSSIEAARTITLAYENEILLPKRFVLTNL